MNRFLKRLKYEPWSVLLQVSLLSIGVWIAIDMLLSFSANRVDGIYNVLLVLYSRQWAGITNEVAGAGLGALAVWIWEVFYQPMKPDPTRLWMLIFCLLVGLLIVYSLPVPGVLVKIGRIPLMGIVIGVFGKGRAYW
jgi:hypothetical protein